MTTFGSVRQPQLALLICAIDQLEGILGRDVLNHLNRVSRPRLAMESGHVGPKELREYHA